jgi:hypothetical protein
MVTFTASPPATIRECRWQVDGPGAFDHSALTTPDRRKPGIIRWDTSGLPSGNYKISVEAKLASPA